jgi:hypothetical protein
MMLVGLLIVTAPAVFSGLLGGPTNSTSHLVMPSPASTKVQCGSAEQKQALLAEAGAQLAEPEPQRAALLFPQGRAWAHTRSLCSLWCAHTTIARAPTSASARSSTFASAIGVPCQPNACTIDADPDPAWFARRFRLMLNIRSMTYQI